MIGKAERRPETVADIQNHKATHLIAVGGTAVLVARAIRSARILAFEASGMEAIRECVVEDMQVMVAVDTEGVSIHRTGPAAWQNRHVSNRRCPPTGRKAEMRATLSPRWERDRPGVSRRAGSSPLPEYANRRDRKTRTPDRG